MDGTIGKVDFLAMIVRFITGDRDKLLLAAKSALARIESDIESPNQKTREGDELRAAIDGR